MSYLEGWSGLIQRQADKHQKDEEKRLNAVKQGAKDIHPEKMKNDDLLAMYDNCKSSMGDHNPKISKEFEKVASKLRTEVLKRLNNNSKDK